VQVSNTGALTIASVGALATSFSAGSAVLTTTGPMTFAVNTTAASVSATSTDTATTNFDNLAVNSGVTLQAIAGDVALQAGDRIIVNSGGNVTASGNLLFFSAFGDTD